MKYLLCKTDHELVIRDCGLMPYNDTLVLQQELLKQRQQDKPEGFSTKTFKMLDKNNIPYMLSGSIGSGFHGQPRATNDADIQQLKKLR
ncbi:MAG: hypothetical protein FVQ80_17705 [Planctomycetes bacterium]|nr:hypothetical protein [Planctomycetota bacterium]